MKRIKIIWQCVIEIVIFLGINFGLITIFSFYFQNKSALAPTTTEYIESLSQFLASKQLWIVLLSSILYLPISYVKLKKQPQLWNRGGFSKIGYFLLIGISASIIWNILLYDIGLLGVLPVPTVTMILTTGILGPILEEILFRGIIYHKLKTSFSTQKVIFLVSFLFAIYHFSLLQGIYTFLFSLLLTKIYHKYQNLWIPIVIHCAGNLAGLIILPVLLKIPNIFLQSILLLLILVFFFTFQIVHNKN